MADWWADAPIVQGSASAPNWWDAAPIVAKPKEDRSVAKDIAYQVPQGIYQGAENLYNLPNNLANWVAKKAGYEPPITPVHLAEDFNAAHGIGEPTTTAGRYAHAVGGQLGASAIPVAGTIAKGAAAVPAITNALSSSVGAGTAGEAAKDAGLSPGWQLVASLLGGAVTPNAVNSLTAKGPPDPRMVEKTLAAQDATAEGITVPRAAVGGSVEKPVAGRLASLPIVGAPINNAARTALDQTKTRLDDIASQYGAGNRASAGEELRDSIADYIAKGSKAPVQRLYDSVDNLTNNSVATPATELQAMVTKLRSAPSEAEKAVNETAIKTIEDDLSKGALTYPEIKSLRTVIGTQLNNKLSPEAATAQPAYKALYGAATKDLQSSIQNAGGQPALDAWQRANRVNQVVSDRRAQLGKIIGVKGDAGDEQVYERMLAMAGDTGQTANISRLLQARKSVSPDTWDNFSSAFIQRMGVNPKTQEFSPDRFLTAYGKLSPEGKQLLFNSTGKGNLATSMDRLQNVMRQFSELYQMGNPSGTGGTTFIAGLLGGGSAAGILGIPATAAGAGGMWLGSKWFAAPANVDKMTRTLQARMAYQRNPNPTTEQRLAQATAALSDSLADQNK